MGKPTICIGKNKDADQLRGNREADQRFVFATRIAFTGRFVSDLFGDHIVGFPTRRLISQSIHTVFPCILIVFCGNCALLNLAIHNADR